MNHSLSLLAASILVCASANATVNFDKEFSDSTLRLDFIFSGDAKHQNIALSKMIATPNWAGRRVNLDHLLLEGTGRLYMTDIESGDTIYAHAFSDLYLEWLRTKEANIRQRAMEASILVPMPRKPVNISVIIDNELRQTAAKYNCTIDPADILIKRPKITSTPPYRYIHKAGSPTEKIDVAILAEGYTEAEMDSFYLHAEKAVESIFSHSPFKNMKDRFNFIAIATPSKESGVSIPRFNDWKDTAFSSHFSTFYSNRYLTTSNISDIHNTIQGLPYEHLIILANTEEYGGGGIYNSYTLTTARNPKFWPVVTHEFGHSFGGLGDEYFYENDVMTDSYPHTVETWEPNTTSLVDFKSKWADMVKEGTPIPTPAAEHEKYGVGVYEGAAYSTHGLYRPYDRCRMRDNAYPDFCPVCQRAIANMIDFYTLEKK